MINGLETSTITQFGLKRETPLEMRRKVSQLFARARQQARRRTLWQWLRGQENQLKTLSNIEGRVRQPAGQAGVVYVPLEKIIGSEGRTGDFDDAFNPLAGHIRERWIGIATARRSGTPLPPIELIQVGGQYFVRDGHHRVSVARAAGQAEIEARILYALVPNC